MGSKRRPKYSIQHQEAADLRLRVLQRDGWRCQQCGSKMNLHVHHMIHLSQLGASSLANLITLCAECHQSAHEPKIVRISEMFLRYPIRDWDN